MECVPALHVFVGAVQLDLTIADRFGKPVAPREWFVVPLQAIDDAVARIRDGSITGLVYDPRQAGLVASPIPAPDHRTRTSD